MRERGQENGIVAVFVCMSVIWYLCACLVFMSAFVHMLIPSDLFWVQYI